MPKYSMNNIVLYHCFCAMLRQDAIIYNSKTVSPERMKRFLFKLNILKSYSYASVKRLFYEKQFLADISAFNSEIYTQQCGNGRCYLLVVECSVIFHLTQCGNTAAKCYEPSFF